jgi:hypothetical protein
MYERLQNKEISLTQWSVFWEVDHLSEVRLAQQKVANVSRMEARLREEEYPKTVVRCVDCHRVKTNIFGESKSIKQLVSEEELKRIQNRIQTCGGCKKEKKNCLLCCTVRDDRTATQIRHMQCLSSKRP